MGIWTVAGTLVAYLKASPDEGAAWAFTPDGSRFLARERAGLGVWETATGRHERTFPTQGVISACAVSPCGRLIAAGDGNRLTIWSWEATAALASFHADRYITAIQWLGGMENVLAITDYAGRLYRLRLTMVE